MNSKRLALCALIVITLASTASANQFTCLFFGTGCPPGPSGVAGSGDVPQPAKPAPFVPTFEQGVTVKSPWGEWPVNADYFATADTAAAICKKLACAYVIEVPCIMGGGPSGCSKLQRMLVFADI